MAPSATYKAYLQKSISSMKASTIAKISAKYQQHEKRERKRSLMCIARWHIKEESHINMAAQYANIISKRRKRRREIKQKAISSAKKERKQHRHSIMAQKPASWREKRRRAMKKRGAKSGKEKSKQHRAGMRMAAKASRKHRKEKHGENMKRNMAPSSMASA